MKAKFSKHISCLIYYSVSSVDRQYIIHHTNHSFTWFYISTLPLTWHARHQLEGPQHAEGSEGGEIHAAPAAARVVLRYQIWQKSENRSVSGINNKLEPAEDYQISLGERGVWHSRGESSHHNDELFMFILNITQFADFNIWRACTCYISLLSSVS